MIAEFLTKDRTTKRYVHYVDSVYCVIKNNEPFFYIREKDGEEHYFPSEKYSLISLESEASYGMENN